MMPITRILSLRQLVFLRGADPFKINPTHTSKVSVHTWICTWISLYNLYFTGLDARRRLDQWKCGKDSIDQTIIQIFAFIPLQKVEGILQSLCPCTTCICCECCISHFYLWRSYFTADHFNKNFSEPLSVYFLYLHRVIRHCGVFSVYKVGAFYVHHNMYLRAYISPHFNSFEEVRIAE